MRRNRRGDKGRGRAGRLFVRATVVASVLVALGCSSEGARTTARTDAVVMNATDSSSHGAIVVTVRDARTRAPVADAVVTAQPGGSTERTDLRGEAVLKLAAGTYAVQATAPGLARSGDVIVPAAPVSASATGIAVTAGATVAATVRLPRIGVSLNLVAIHAPGGAFTTTNCVACHGDHRWEEPVAPAVKPFHSQAKHLTLECTYCHRAVDLAEDSGATLRKQVDVKTVCRSCHASYPAAF